MPDAQIGTLRWEAYEHEHIERGSDWFWALGIIAACAGVTSIIFGNFLFALVIFVAAFTIGLIAKQPPELHEFEIGPKGIRIGNDLHAYDSIIAFWVDDELEEPLLLVDTTKFMTPNLVIPVGDMDPEEVREYLRAHTEEVRMQEPIAHKILEFFGF